MKIRFSSHLPIPILLSVGIVLILVGSVYGQPIHLKYSHILVDRLDSSMLFNPTKEFIFGTPVKTEHLKNPLGKYYLYYSPHDAPGGICLAYSDYLSGPYIEYIMNPIISNVFQGIIDVSHVASPHVLWMADNNKYIMYFHGENTMTRWAHSMDGISWSIEENNIALQASDWGADFVECSYARVFEHSIPGVGNRYIMLMMLLESGHGRRIGLATSDNGTDFEPYDEALISPSSEEGSDIAGPFFFPFENTNYILYHSSTGYIHYADVGKNFDKEDHKGVFFYPREDFPEFNKAADPVMILENGQWNMIYNVGLRLKQSIGFAIQVPNEYTIVVDNEDDEFSFRGNWLVGSTINGDYGINHLQVNSLKPTQGTWSKWKPEFLKSGYYRVMVRWPANRDRPDSVRYKLYHHGEIVHIYKNQQKNNGSWISLGQYYFDKGVSDANCLMLDAGSDMGYSVADAAWFIYDHELVTGFDLFDNDESLNFVVSPNPFDRKFQVTFNLKKPAFVQINILDLNGSQVDVLLKGNLLSGGHKCSWYSENLESGMYVIHLKVDNAISKSYILMKR